LKQFSEDWFKAKIGKVGASRIKDVMAKGQGKTRESYMMELLTARLTGEYPESYTSTEMQRGIETEAEAKAYYELITGNVVTETGWIDCPDVPMSGASPDGLIGIDGLIEVKCPNTSTHIKTILSGKIQTGYIYQMMWQMYCTETDWCDFVSYDNRLPDDLKLYVQRVQRNNILILEIKDEVVKFNQELDDLIKKLRG
jgi:putative phage-type endonuclease